MDGILKHSGIVHSHQPNFRVVCGIDGCPKAYSNYHSFRKHLRRKHNETVLELRPPGSRTYEFCSLEEDLEVSQDNDMNYWSKYSCIQFLCIQFLLKCKEVGQMPQGVINDLQCDITMLVENALDTLQAMFEVF